MHQSPLILVIDDTASILELLHDLLTTVGYRCRTASNGHQALADVLVYHPDLILLDIMMPGMNGFEFIHALQEWDSAIPVVVFTADSSPATWEKLDALKVAGRIQEAYRKPLPPIVDILERVGSLLAA